MKNKNIILLRTLLLSTSRGNIIRHAHDKKKRGKYIKSIVGLVILYALIMLYSVLTVIGYGIYGLIDATPVMCGLIISALAGLFTFFKTNGYLFNFKEYDMLMSLPFEARTIAACKFMYMYIQSLPWYLTVSIAMMAGYGYYKRPFALVYLVWIVLSFFLPIIPMLIASFLGFLIARVSTGFRKTNLIQTILAFALCLAGFGLRFVLEAMFRDDKVQTAFEQTSEATENAGKVYLPVGWFSNAVNKLDVLSILLLVGTTVLLFGIVFTLVGNSYRNINSALKNHAAAKSYKMDVQKKRGVLWSIAFKEFKRLTASTTYMVNGSMGELLALILGVFTLILGFDNIVKMVTNNAPMDPAMLQPAIPFIVYFLIGMMATTACSPSLEGKNYWIIKSLPLEMKTVYQGKMLFNMCLTVPFSIFATLCLCISSKTPVVEAILYLILGVVLCAFSTAWGCVCGVKHMRLDWENEVEVVKQGAGVTVYLLPNMFASMILIVVMVVLGGLINRIVLALLMIVLVSVLAVLSYTRVLALAKKE
ncbi:MAG: hypothetical protein K6F37_05525 [Lachnospiraceae bacterium]|nr:hypothetical protein [Lachnospiraceae bacterium]